jgi:hypothetical protein
MFGSIGVPELLILVSLIAMLAVVAWPACRICRRIGYPPMLGLLAVVPVANLILLWFVALSRWPLANPRQGGA